MAEIQEDCRRLANVETGEKETPLGEKETPLGEKAIKVGEKANFVGEKKLFISDYNIDPKNLEDMEESESKLNKPIA